MDASDLLYRNKDARNKACDDVVVALFENVEMRRFSVRSMDERVVFFYCRSFLSLLNSTRQQFSLPSTLFASVLQGDQRDTKTIRADRSALTSYAPTVSVTAKPALANKALRHQCSTNRLKKIKKSPFYLFLCVCYLSLLFLYVSRF